MKLEKTFDRIHQKLADAFAPLIIEIRDESHKHAGHAGYRASGETHFKIRLISEAFIGKCRLERHRAVYAVLEEDMKEGGIHAVTIEALTPQEKN